MIPLSQYAKVKNNYCLCYFGYSDEYLVLLRLLRPALMKKFPGVDICFGCKKDKANILRGCKVMDIGEIKMKRHDYAHIREIRFEKNHPIEELLIESDITSFALNLKNRPRTNNHCVIIKNGAHPTKPLGSEQLEKVKKLATSQGYVPVVTDEIEDASWVIGVESVSLFEAADNGIRTTLVDNGVGLRLYRTLWPNSEVFA